MTPFQKRIVAAYQVTKQYHAMLEIVFPEERSHRRSSNGGPPACVMPFGRALRALGGGSHGMGGDRVVYLPNAVLLGNRGES